MRKIMVLALIGVLTLIASGCGEPEKKEEVKLDPTPRTFTENVETETILYEDVTVEWEDF